MPFSGWSLSGTIPFHCSLTQEQSERASERVCWSIRDSGQRETVSKRSVSFQVPVYYSELLRCCQGLGGPLLAEPSGQSPDSILLVLTVLTTVTYRNITAVTDFNMWLYTHCGSLRPYLSVLTLPSSPPWDTLQGDSHAAVSCRNIGKTPCPLNVHENNEWFKVTNKIVK